LITGVDEAGRGALAGPVVAAAIMLPQDFFLDGCNDSKTLTPKQREHIFSILQVSKWTYSLGLASPNKITELNIFHASLLAMKKAILKLKVKPDKILIDGKFVPIIKDHEDITAIIKGDQRYPCISAASIIAKVVRDKIMMKYHQRFPQYGFASHKGYATKKHYENILKFGLLPIHRSSFKLYRSENRS